MPTYLRPGVYIEESLRPLSNLDVDPAEAAAAFVGKTKSGPVGPVLVTSWNQFQALYGSISYATDDLPFAVHTYFSNGGRGAYIVRALPDDSTAATAVLYDGTGTETSDEVLTITASAPGVWASDANGASRVFLTVRPSKVGGNRFDLTVDVGNNAFLAASETFVDLSMDPADTRYAVDVVNSPIVGSKFIDIQRSANIAAGNPPPGPATKTPMTGGSDGTEGSIDFVEAAQRLDAVDRNLVINLPAADVDVVTSVVNWAQEGGRHFIVADGPRPQPDETPAASVTALVAFADALPASSHVAVYGPWTYNADPGSTAGALRLTAPGGAVLGQYMRTDASRGVHKAPAGVQTVLSSVVQVAHHYTNTQQDTLAGAAVNLIRSVPGAGIVIWGARTQAIITPDRYIPVRRLLIALKTALYGVTRFAVFEGNDEDLRATVEDVVGAYLQQQFDLDAFKGASPDQAYYVICDDSNNNEADVDAGLINVEVGVALKSPAEFVVIRLGQTQAGATATDDLEVT